MPTEKALEGKHSWFGWSWLAMVSSQLLREGLHAKSSSTQSRWSLHHNNTFGSYIMALTCQTLARQERQSRALPSALMPALLLLWSRRHGRDAMNAHGRILLTAPAPAQGQSRVPRFHFPLLCHGARLEQHNYARHGREVTDVCCQGRQPAQSRAGHRRSVGGSQRAFCSHRESSTEAPAHNGTPAAEQRQLGRSHRASLRMYRALPL